MQALWTNKFVVWAGVAGVVVTAVVLLIPDVPIVVRSSGLQAVVETAGGVATLAAALIVFGRFRAEHTAGIGMLFGALVTFGLANLVLGALPATLSMASPALDTWGALSARMLAALAFGAAPFVRSRRPIPLYLPLLPAALVVAAATVLAVAFGDLLPEPVRLDEAVRDVTELSPHPLVAAANILGLVAYLFAAWGFARGRPDDGLFRDLAGASILGAFSRLNLALVPSLYTGAVYSGDLFRLAFHAAVLVAAVREIARYWRDREELAVAEERRRVARELHDGVAQELAFITSTTARMDGDGTHRDVQLIASAARRALDESRRAIAMLSRSVDEPLPVALEETLSELAGRTGGRIIMDLEPSAVVPPVVREEILRIAREAVGNALRHGAPSVVEVSLCSGERLTMTITDDGQGFDVDSPPNRFGFGLTGMRERAAALGASLSITSTPGSGTTVRLEL